MDPRHCHLSLGSWQESSCQSAHFLSYPLKVCFPHSCRVILLKIKKSNHVLFTPKAFLRPFMSGRTKPNVPAMARQSPGSDLWRFSLILSLTSLPGHALFKGWIPRGKRPGLHPPSISTVLILPLWPISSYQCEVNLHTRFLKRLIVGLCWLVQALPHKTDAHCRNAA